MSSFGVFGHVTLAAIVHLLAKAQTLFCLNTLIIWVCSFEGRIRLNKHRFLPQSCLLANFSLDPSAVNGHSVIDRSLKV